MSRKETGFGFSFRNHLKDTEALAKHFVKKIDKIEERFRLRKGPELYWLRENEDDSKIIVPDDKFKSGIPTISRLLYDFESGIAAIGAEPNAGKALRNDQKVLTPDGWLEISKLQVGDKVINSKGAISLVTGVFPQGIKETVKLNFSDGTSSICSEDHLWFTKSRYERQKGEIGSVKSTKEIIKSLKSGDRNRHILPNFNPIEFKEKNLELDPYVLGILLGDGSITENTRFTSLDQEIIKNVTEKIPGGLSVVSQSSKPNKGFYGITGEKGNPNPISLTLECLGLRGCNSNNKFIPSIYLLSSIKQRTSLLQGLMDSDGYISKDGRMEFSVSSKELAGNFIELVRSLGGVARLTINSSSYKKEGKKIDCKDRYRVKFTLPEEIIPFKLSRKKIRISKKKGPKNYRFLHKSIESYERLESGLCTCITVDSEDHLFITEGFTLTHNSTLIVSMATSILELQDDVIVIDLTLDDSISKRYVQYICSMSGLPYQWIYNIENVPDAAKDAYEFAKKRYKNWIEEGRYFPFEGIESFNLDSKNIDVLINSEEIFHDMLESFREYAGDKKVVFFADAFNDMNFDRDRIAKLDESVKNLKHTANANLVKMFVTSHLRKVEKRNQELSLNDLKGSKELEFSAAYAGLLRNDKKENPEDFLTIERDGIELPVLILESPKNKVSAWDQNWYAGMRPETCQLFPVTKQEYLMINDQYLKRKREKK